MQTGNPLLDDVSRLMTGMVGAAQAAGEEAKTMARGQAERIISDMDPARREEVEALKDLARSALEKVDALEKRVAELEAASSGHRGSA